MRKPRLLAVAAAGALLAIAVACTATKPKVTVDPARLQAFKALPVSMDSADNPLTDEKINLGRMLYYDPRLSKGQDVSCNTCHELSKYGVDAGPVSTDIWVDDVYFLE